MAIPELIAAGVQLTVTGMLVVFVLLGLLVFAVTGASRLAHALAPKTSAPAAKRPTAAGEDRDADAELVSVVSAAIHRYRLHHRR